MHSPIPSSKETPSSIPSRNHPFPSPGHSESSVQTLGIDQLGASPTSPASPSQRLYTAARPESAPSSGSRARRALDFDTTFEPPAKKQAISGSTGPTGAGSQALWHYPGLHRGTIDEYIRATNGEPVITSSATLEASLHRTKSI